jgi:two-component system, OmpR family, sensor kinase
VTLRRRLVAIQVALVAIGLAVSGTVSYQLYSHSQYERITTELQGVSRGVGFSLVGQNRFGPRGGRPADAPSRPPARATLPPEGAYGELRSAATGAVVGSTLSRCTKLTSSARCAVPELPANLYLAPNSSRLLTVSSTNHDSTFRVLITNRAGFGVPPGLVLVVAVPFGDVQSALHNLLTLEILVGTGVLIALSVTAWLVIRRDLHPLARMAGTARDIAGGDLSRRVSPADGRTEVGQLGLALNTMLSDIEQAFAAREDTEQRLRQFLADASHELRTPLTSIRGYAELWRLGAVSTDEERETVMRRIEEHADRMGLMVEDLLLLARLDETRPARREPVDLAVLAAVACDEVSAAAHGSDHALRLKVSGPVVVEGDETHLRQAAVNLLTNAIRHTPPGTPVEVTVGADAGSALLCVRDHGPGLSAEGLAHAFDRFWQADRTRHQGGSGLGLAIVAAVAAEHRGMATVANAATGGAIFTVLLPGHTGDHLPPEDDSSDIDVPVALSAPARDSVPDVS